VSASLSTVRRRDGKTTRRRKSRSLRGGAHKGPCAYALELSLEFVDLLGAPAGRLADPARPRWHEPHGSGARSRASSSLRLQPASSSLAPACVQLHALQPASSSCSPARVQMMLLRPDGGGRRRPSGDGRRRSGTVGDGQAGRRKTENLVLDLKDLMEEELRLSGGSCKIAFVRDL
jgi:hypothetical protein